MKVYWNEIPLTDGGGNTYLNLVDLNELTGAEIIKGPAASTYGAGTGGAGEDGDGVRALLGRRLGRDVEGQSRQADIAAEARLGGDRGILGPCFRLRWNLGCGRQRLRD